MNIEAIKLHVNAATTEAKSDMAKGQWDEVMTDALYAASGAESQEEMREAKAIAEDAVKQ